MSDRSTIDLNQHRAEMHKLLAELQELRQQFALELIDSLDAMPTEMLEELLTGTASARDASKSDELRAFWRPLWALMERSRTRRLLVDELEIGELFRIDAL